MEIKKENYYIVRGDRSGVFFGKIKEKQPQRDGKSEVLMSNVKRIHYWDGAASISQLAIDGTSLPNSCRITEPVSEVVIMDAIEINTCTEKATKNLLAVPVWKK